MNTAVTPNSAGGPQTSISGISNGTVLSARDTNMSDTLANPTIPLGLNTVHTSANVKPVALFSHLITDNSKPPPLTGVHPYIRSLALKFASYKIVGANARCIAMLTAFRRIIQEYRTPIGHTLCRHLPAYLSPQISFLVGARPMSVGMGNAVRVLKYEISRVGMETSEATVSDGRGVLCEKCVAWERRACLWDLWEFVPGLEPPGVLSFDDRIC